MDRARLWQYILRFEKSDDRTNRMSLQIHMMNMQS